MVLAYLIHGAGRGAVDGLRLVCFVLGAMLAGQMMRYARLLSRYTTSPSWQGGLMRYLGDWVSLNKRLLGRILLCVTWLWFLATTAGTEIKQWGEDMGYWRLPCNALALGLSVVALHFLIHWNNLNQN